MFAIYLTDISTDERVAELLTVDDHGQAADLCVSLQPYLRDGIEAHFVSDDEYPDGETAIERKYASYLQREAAEGGGMP
jgi:hypothetical protein